MKMPKEKSPISQLFTYLKPFKSLFIFSCASSFVNKVLDLMPPLLVAWVIDTVRREPPSWISYFSNSLEPFPIAVFLALLGVGIFAFESIFEWMYQYGFMNLAQKVQHSLRMDAYNHIQAREVEFFENHRMGETMAMLNDDVNQLERFLNTSFNEILQLCVLFLFAGLVLFATSWELALVGIIPIPIILWGSLFYQKKISPRYQRVRQAVGALNSRLENNIAGILVIKSFTAEKFETKRVEEASKEYKDSNYNAIILSSVYVPLIRMGVSIGFGGVLLIGSYWVLQENGILTVGELVLFSMMIQRLLWPLTRLGGVLDELERARASAKRTFGILNKESKIQDSEDPKYLDKVGGKIEFENVVFKYAQGENVLEGLNFKVNAGETIGFAGATGAGKSTLIKLLLRLYDVTEGAVKIDGIDLRDLKLNDLRKNISLVSQDVYLFHGTIAENIAYGMENASLREITKASQMAQLHGFVETLKDGYETIVGERGIKLSGGQRQRLSIARAILKNAPIMVFDEATSSVDTETERAIQENLMNFTAGKTALVIAHRLSTIRHADKILVLKNGKIAEEGHHDDLLELNGVYSDLWHIQSGDLKTKEQI